MPSNVFLVRTGETAWRGKRVLGRRDVGLSEAGLAQAWAAADSLAPVTVDELIASPLARATETAGCIAERFKVDLARDQRLTAIDVGPWEGRALEDLERDPGYQKLRGLEGEAFPMGERLADVRDRVVASVEQALTDNSTGSNIVLVLHGGPLRVALAHYLGMPLGHYPRLRAAHGSLSMVRFTPDYARCDVLVVNGGIPVHQAM